jgi:peroxiredoxin
MPLLASIALASMVQSELSDLYARVSKLPGVAIECEMARPSNVPMSFRIAPKKDSLGPRLWAKYPSSEQFISPKSTITWMPDRREYAEAVTEPGNPCPAGFESLWGTEGWLTQTGPAVKATFQGRTALSIPCKAVLGHEVTLFVADGLPIGTIATAQGNTFEMVYRSVKVGSIPDVDTNFVLPKDARKSVPGQRPADLLPKGTKFPNFSGLSLKGKELKSVSLMKRQRGIVINFWFSACTGCIQEMPMLSELHAELKKDRITLLGVNTVDEPKYARKTATSKMLPFETLTGKGAETLTAQSKVQAYPATYILNAKGVVVDSFFGVDEKRLRAGVQTLRAK